MLNQPRAYPALPFFFMSFRGWGRRPRINHKRNRPAATTSAPLPAPETVKAKYEGGVFGYPHKLDGTLSFDDVNKRLLFRNETQTEVLFIPYNALTGAYADTHKVRPTAASLGRVAPAVGLHIC